MSESTVETDDIGDTATRSSATAPLSGPTEIVTEEQLTAVARYLERMGVPALAGNYFPLDTRRAETILALIALPFWGGAIVSFLVVISSYQTPNYGAHLPRWLAIVGALVLVGCIALLARRELRRARVGPGRPRMSTRRLLLRAAELVIWLIAIGYMLWDLLVATRGDAGSLVLLLILLAGFSYRFAMQRMISRNIVTLSWATARALLNATKASPALSTNVRLMLSIVLFLFITGDAWRLFGRMEKWRFWMLVVLLAIVVAAGLARQLPRPMSEVSDWTMDFLSTHASMTPAKAIVDAGVNPLLVIDRITPWTKLNLIAPIWLARGVKVLGSAAALTVILLGIGLVMIGRDQTQDLVGNQLPHIVPFTLGGIEVDLSEALTKVAIMLSLSAAAYFVVVGLSNPETKSRFLQDDQTDRLSQVLAAWAYFAGALATREPYARLGNQPIYRRDIRGVDLRGADLTDARIDQLDMRGARANAATKWPQEFDPIAHGIRVR
jgi:hypothetical protein